MTLQCIEPHYIANFRLFPGFTTDILRSILQQPIKGLILETYGSGNAQNNDAAFLSVLNEATQNNIIIINCTQCVQGRVEMGQYATSYSLAKAGVISGHDMTPEAAHCKLLTLISKGLNPAEIKEHMVESLCGELTVV